MWWIYTMLRILLVFVLTKRGLGRSAKDWNALSEKELDEMWREGDEEDELRTESEIYQEMIEKKKKEHAVDVSQIQSLGPEEIKKKVAHQQSNSGMAMIFVTLTSFDENGVEWSEDSEQSQASKFTALLQTGGLKVSAYRIEPRRLLMTMQTGWYANDLKDFLIAQHTVMKVTWDSIDYLNPNAKQEALPQSASQSKEERISENKSKKKKKIKKKKKETSSSSTARSDET